MTEPGREPSAELLDVLDEFLLGGPRKYTRLEVAAAAGMAPERTQRLWRALGFPDVGDDVVAFTDADIEALAALSALIDTGFVGPDAEASIARSMGQALSRLADWQTDLFADVLTGQHAGGDPTQVSPGDAVAAGRMTLPLLSRLQDYVWRRHLAANGERLRGALAGGERRELAVGFADLVGYTSRSRDMGGRELGQMVEAFESTAAEVIARHRGRVIKTVGDGVLFTAVDAVDAVEIALAMVETWLGEDRPPLRVGLAYGPVLTRLGDVYSAVVNLASRLTALARAGTVLVDRELAGRMRGHPAYRLRRLRRVSVRGYDHLEPWRVRRRSPDDVDEPEDDEGGDDEGGDDEGGDDEARDVPRDDLDDEH